MKNHKFTIRRKLAMLMSGIIAGASVYAAVNSGDASLSDLELRVDGRNILSSFSSSTTTYNLELDDASMLTMSAVPSASDATVAIDFNGAPMTNHSLANLEGGDNVITYTVRSGNSTKTYTVNIKTPQVVRDEYFTWKNANIYFVLTDRFYNGDTSNDNSYHRKRLSGDADVATFHGGDIKGLTQKLDYLDKLGVNAIWITAPYEQMHGWTGGKNDAFPHYAFHGYYALDWTYMDRNMGTIQDMKNFVTEAHKRGIRVVMDIVMNHTGYCTLDDGVDYEFGNFNGTPQAGWVPSDKPYSMWSESNEISFNADEQGNWGNWWGPWVRAFGDRSWASNAGFAPEGGSDYDKPLAGLPDIVTDRTSPVDIPPFLKMKWAAEKGGDYDNYRLPNLEGWRTDSKGAPADYLINWLAGWVEYFGIDGFRCDTAKHLEKSRWNQLKNACKQALNNWRNSDRADEYAKGWDEDFWMTGEAFGWDHGDVGYFTEGGFDSMINFAFNSSEGSQGRTPSTEDWRYYANYCNGSNGRQVLNYVSSHDTGLHRPGDQKKVATMFLLCPGGAQIYYGDETSRPYMSSNCGGDQSMITRSDFNWDAVDNADNKHWQTIGQFRRRNAAVGAGTQTDLGSDTYGRKFSEGEYSNAVVIKLNTSAGQTYTVNVGDHFADGAKVMDGYNTANTATVSGGKVTIAASGPVLLLEPYGTIQHGPNPQPVKPTVRANPPSGSTFTESVTVTLSSTQGAAIHYTVDGSTPSESSDTYSAPLNFTQTTTLKTYVSNANGSNVQTFTYTKGQASKPVVTASPAGGEFEGNVSVTLSVNPVGTAIHYSTAGAATASSPVYSSALTFTETTTLSTYVENAAGSNVQSFTYTKKQGGDEDEHYVYYDGTFSAPQVWAWIDANTNCTAAGSWPGDNMTKKNGKWYWAVPSGKSVPKQIIIHEGNNRIGGGDLNYVDKVTYHQDGSYTSNGDDPNPRPIPGAVKVYYKGSWNPVNVYIKKAGAGASAPSNGEWPGVAMTKESGKDYWSYTVPENLQSGAKVIFNDGSEQYPVDVPGQECGLDLNGKSMMYDGGTGWSEFSEGSKPSITINPNGGNVKGSATITVVINNDATSISGTFNGKSLSLQNGSNNVSVSQYLTSDKATGSFSVSATNAQGTTTANVSFTRDDYTPVYEGNLTGDWRELSIYQVMVGSFQHGDGGAPGYSQMWGPDGHRKNGNLRGIIDALDYIKDLGMNAIWMTPVFDSSNGGNGDEKLKATGYFANNFFAIDPHFGTEAEFDELVRKAHEKDMYIILDGVFGHHSNATGASPNGYYIDNRTVSNVRGDSHGNIAYPGSLNYFKEVIRYWMERGVDGWRLDQCYQVYQGGHNYWKELREECETVARERKARGEQWGTLGYMVGEDWTGAAGITVTQQDGLKSVMDFDAKDYLVNLRQGVSTIGWLLSTDAAGRGYRDSGVIPTLFISNHDTDRVGDYVDVNSKPNELITRHAAVAAYSGPVCTYYGDEIGDKRGQGGNSDNWSRTSGRISGFNANEQKVHDYTAKYFKARAANPALWRGTVSRQEGNKCEIIIKTDSQTGNKVICIFSETDQNVSIGGSGIDLINGGNVSGNVSVKAWIPAFIKMN